MDLTPSKCACSVARAILRILLLIGFVFMLKELPAVIWNVRDQNFAYGQVIAVLAVAHIVLCYYVYVMISGLFVLHPVPFAAATMIVEAQELWGLLNLGSSLSYTGFYDKALFPFLVIPVILSLATFSAILYFSKERRGEMKGILGGLRMTQALVLFIAPHVLRSRPFGGVFIAFVVCLALIVLYALIVAMRAVLKNIVKAT